MLTDQQIYQIAESSGLAVQKYFLSRDGKQVFDVVVPLESEFSRNLLAFARLLEQGITNKK